METKDQFWRFVCERQQIYHKRYELGLPEPWTDDPILARCHFTNMYRELDRGTIWFQDFIKRVHITERPVGRKQSILLWVATVYRLVNRVSTFEAFGGIPSPTQSDEFMKFITERKAGGAKVFTGRHQVIGLEAYGKTLSWLRDNCVAFSKKLASLDPEKAIHKLKDIPGVGTFFANQIYLDLLESGYFPKATENDYIEVGPGAVAGLKIIFDVRPTENLQVPIKFLVTEQKAAFQELGLDMPFYQGKPLTMKNIEHALCEFAKWHRAKNGGAPPGNRNH